MSDLGTSVALLQAVVDLSLIKSIRSAIRVNTLKAGGVEGPLGNIENPKPGVRGQFGIDPEPRYEPRRVIHPEPRYELQVVHHRTVERPALAELKQPLPPEQTTLPACATAQSSPLAPPWEMPLPIEPTLAIRVVKYEQSKPDLICKGMLIDLFI